MDAQQGNIFYTGALKTLHTENTCDVVTVRAQNMSSRNKTMINLELLFDHGGEIEDDVSQPFHY